MHFKTIGSLRNLTRRNKLILLILTDCLIAFLCWVVFGPPFSFMIASNFELSLYQLIKDNILSRRLVYKLLKMFNKKVNGKWYKLGETEIEEYVVKFLHKKLKELFESQVKG